jgi:hypothetical protein
MASRAMENLGFMWVRRVFKPHLRWQAAPTEAWTIRQP